MSDSTETPEVETGGEGDAAVEPPKPNHPAWPKPGEHLWTEWFAQRPREGLNPPTQYRTCIHPECKVTETRVAPVA